jgi:hypothetical protein
MDTILMPPQKTESNQDAEKDGSLSSNVEESAKVLL